MARTKKRNPAAAKEPLFPHFLPDYPVKPWVDPATGERFQTVSVDLPDGTFLAFVAEAPEVRAVAQTRAEAERAVLAAWRRQNPEEDEALAALAKHNLKTHKFVPLRQALKVLGYGMDGKRLR